MVKIIFFGGSPGGIGQLSTISECVIPEINLIHCF